MNVDNEAVHALTGAYVLDALEPDELAAFERHLAVCPDCREEVRSLRAAVVRLPAISAVAPPAELRDSVLSAISGVRPLPPLPEQLDDGPRPSPEAPAPASDEVASRRDRRADRRADRWRLVAAAAVVVALASVAWGVVRPDPGPGRETGVVERVDDERMIALLAAPDLEVYPVEAEGEIAGTMLRSQELASAALVLHGLPELDPDEVFQAWTIVDASPASAGVFAARDGGAAVMLDGDVTAAQAVAVTIEPSGGSPSPTGEILLQVAVSDA